MNNIIKKILITGGACAGKTSSIEEIKNHYEKENYKVFVVTEVPTALITSGIIPKEIGNMNFIKLVIDIQIKLKNYYYEMAKKIIDKNVIIIFDGGPLDCIKFISKEDFNNLIKEYNYTYDDILKDYDGVIHLETVAKRIPELYSNETNLAREINPDISVKRDDLLLKIYKSHFNRIVIKACDDFKEKVNNVLKACDKIINI